MLNSYIAEYPLGCVGEDCLRGANAPSINFAQQIITLICIFVVLVSVIILWNTVLQRERALDRYNSSGAATAASTREQSKKVGRQGMYYSGCFFLSWSPWIIITFMQFAKVTVHPGVGVFAACMLPLQGLFNAFVYFRPRMVAKSEQKKAASTTMSQTNISMVSKATLNRRSTMQDDDDDADGDKEFANEVESGV